MKQKYVKVLDVDENGQEYFVYKKLTLIARVKIFFDIVKESIRELGE